MEKLMEQKLARLDAEYQACLAAEWHKDPPPEPEDDKEEHKGWQALEDSDDSDAAESDVPEEQSTTESSLVETKGKQGGSSITESFHVANEDAKLIKSSVCGLDLPPPSWAGKVPEEVWMKELIARVSEPSHSSSLSSSSQPLSQTLSSKPSSHRTSSSKPSSSKPSSSRPSSSKPSSSKQSSKQSSKPSSAKLSSSRASSKKSSPSTLFSTPTASAPSAGTANAPSASTHSSPHSTGSTSEKRCAQPECGKVEREGQGNCKALLRCGRCKAAWYCSPQCQKKHWGVHKKKCQPSC